MNSRHPGQGQDKAIKKRGDELHIFHNLVGNDKVPYLSSKMPTIYKNATLSTSRHFTWPTA